jgi:plasmid maintenance system killer protein
MDRDALQAILARQAEQAAFDRDVSDRLLAQQQAVQHAQRQRNLRVPHLQRKHNILKMEQNIVEMKPSKWYALTLHYQSFSRQASHDVKQMGISPRK